MQREIQTTLQQQFSLGDKFRQSLNHDPQNVITKTYHRDLNNLKVTYEQLDPQVFHTCVAKIAKARRVAVLGLRASACPAVYLSFALNLVRANVTQLRLELDNIHDQLLDFSDKDVLIAFSLARPARRTILTVKEAKQRYSACVIGITHSRVSPLGQLADHSLIASAEGTFNSYTAIMSLCGALMEAVANQLRDKAEARLRRLDSINSEDVVVR
jgi:DNA-binding MurR/RpiR family transcriptional regulator